MIYNFNDYKADFMHPTPMPALKQMATKLQNDCRALTVQTPSCTVLAPSMKTVLADINALGHTQIQESDQFQSVTREFVKVYELNANNQDIKMPMQELMSSVDKLTDAIFKSKLTLSLTIEATMNLPLNPPSSGAPALTMTLSPSAYPSTGSSPTMNIHL